MYMMNRTKCTFKKVILIEFVHRAQRKQFRQSRQKLHAQVSFSCVQRPKKLNKIFSSANCFFSQSVSCTGKCKFDNSVETFSLKSKQFSAQSMKKIRRTEFLSANWLFFKVFPGHKKCTFDNSAAIFSLKSDFFCSKWENDWKISGKTFEKLFSVQMLLWTRRM